MLSAFLYLTAENQWIDGGVVAYIYIYTYVHVCMCVQICSQCGIKVSA